MPVNYIMLAVISGIIGLVVGAFTGWHILLASRGQTTIECLEKTRYLSPLRKQLQANYIASHAPGAATPGYGQQLLDIHSNALPGITRPEEGEDFRRETPALGRSTPSNAHAGNGGTNFVQPLITGPTPPAQQNDNSLRMSYADLERYQAQKRYEAYMDDQDSTKLPHAFDLGPKKNLLHLFGHKWYLWGLPFCTTTGDGWAWEPSQKWIEARDRIAREREEQRHRERAAGWGEPDSPVPPRWTTEVTRPPGGAGRFYENGGGTGGLTPYASGGMNGRKVPSKADRILGRDPNLYADTIQPASKKTNNDFEMKKLPPRGVSDLDLLSDGDDDYLDDEEAVHARTGGKKGQPVKGLVLQPGVGVGASGLLRKNSPTGMTPPLGSPRPPLRQDEQKGLAKGRQSEDDGVD